MKDLKTLLLRDLKFQTVSRNHSEKIPCLYPLFFIVIFSCTVFSFSACAEQEDSISQNNSNNAFQDSVPNRMPQNTAHNNASLKENLIHTSLSRSGYVSWIIMTAKSYKAEAFGREEISSIPGKAGHTPLTPFISTHCDRTPASKSRSLSPGRRILISGIRIKKHPDDPKASHYVFSPLKSFWRYITSADYNEQAEVTIEGKKSFSVQIKRSLLTATADTDYKVLFQAHEERKFIESFLNEAINKKRIQKPAEVKVNIESNQIKIHSLYAFESWGLDTSYAEKKINAIKWLEQQLKWCPY